MMFVHEYTGFVQIWALMSGSIAIRKAQKPECKYGRLHRETMLVL